MARYKPYDLNQAKMIPISYADQVVEGSFEHALNEIVEEHLDLTVFDQRYCEQPQPSPPGAPQPARPPSPGMATARMFLRAFQS